MDWERLKLYCEIFWSKKVQAQCGHQTRTVVLLHIYEEERFLQLPLDDDGTTPACWDCLEKMTIRCAWCGKPIFIGDPVTLNSPADGALCIPQYAVVYSCRPLRLVGCLRMGCANSGAERAGFWQPPGEVFRVLSPLEMCLLGKKSVIVGDATDIAEALAMQEVFDAS